MKHNHYQLKSRETYIYISTEQSTGAVLRVRFTQRWWACHVPIPHVNTRSNSERDQTNQSDYAINLTPAGQPTSKHLCPSPYSIGSAFFIHSLPTLALKNKSLLPMLASNSRGACLLGDPKRPREREREMMISNVNKDIQGES